MPVIIGKTVVSINGCEINEGQEFSLNEVQENDAVLFEIMVRQKIVKCVNSWLDS